MVYIHDGVYVQPCPDEFILRLAVDTACHAVHIENIFLENSQVVQGLLQQFLSTCSTPTYKENSEISKQSKFSYTFQTNTPIGKRKAFV